MRGLEGKTAIVTGGGGAIGRAICQRLAGEGAVVGVFDRDPQTAAQTVGIIRNDGGRAMDETVDITDYQAVATAVQRFEQEAAPTDILVNNAGWDLPVNFLDSKPDFWEKVIAINLTGPLVMHHAVVRGMADRRCGRVVNISSDAGRVGSSGESVYAACKGGIIAFTKTLARELARTGVTLNCVCPGPTDTPLLASFAGEGESGEKLIKALTRAIPMGRLGQPEDIAPIVALLASDEAAFITGQVISVSGGLTMHG